MITIKNIKEYIEGNSKLFLSELGLQPDHIKEQISYRMLKCEDCLKNKKCIKCGCSVPGKLYVSESCNPDRFPNLMSGPEWEEFKKTL